MKWFETKFRNRIGQRLIIGVFIISIAVVALTAASTTWLDYCREMREVDQHIGEIQRTHAKAIANSLWIFDRQQLVTQMEGLLNIRYVNYIAVMGPEKTLAEVGSFRKDGVFAREIPLTYSYNERLVPLGTLYVQAYTSPVLHRVLQHVFIVVICQGVLIVSMALSLSLLFRNLVMRHVSAAADHFGSFNIAEENRPLLLQKRRYGDELDTLEDTFNQMTEKLHNTYTDLIHTKREIQDSEERFRAVFENAAVGIDLLDREGRFVHVNSALCTMLGYSPDELRGLDYVRVTHPEDFPASREQLEALVKAVIGSSRMEMRYLRKDGTTMWGDLSISVVRDFEGHYRATVGVISDITERKRAEEALRESEAKYRNLFNNAEVGMFRTRLDGSEILDMNVKFLKIFGRTREEMRGNPSVIHWADPLEREEMVRRLKADGRVTDFECKLFNNQGEERICVTSLRLNREQGLLEGSIIDITDRKKAESAIQESEQRLSQIINFLPDATVAVDREGRVIAWNRAMEEMTGVPAEEMMGKGDYEYALPFYGTRRPILLNLVLTPNEEIRQAYSFRNYSLDKGSSLWYIILRE